MAADRQLLFGLLALHTGLIDHTALMAAFHAWTRDKARPLADQLVALGYLDPAHRPLLVGLPPTAAVAGRGTIPGGSGEQAGHADDSCSRQAINRW